jgi:hypothetical protein
MGTALRRLAAIHLVLATLASCRTSPSKGGNEPAADVAQARLAIPIGERMMQPLGDGLYTEPGLTDREQLELKHASETAQRNLQELFGTLRGQPPITLFCHTAACKIALGAPPADAASTNLGFARNQVRTAGGPVTHPTLIVSGPFEATPRVLTHERVHAEMKAYAPYDALPTWFNEGLATFIAHEPRCEDHPLSSSFDVKSLDTKQKWQAHLRATGATLATYCQARNEVSVWVESFASTAEMIAALKKAMNAVAQGRPFVL